MNLRHWWKAELLSARDLVRRSLVVLALFALVHVAGLREFTSIVNGTVGSVTLGWHLSAFLGLLYMVLYFGAVLLVPILWIAAGLLSIASWFCSWLRRDTGTDPRGAGATRQTLPSR